MQLLVAMSGGVDSSVAAALLKEAGHEVVGVTMKLWGGASDTGCCSVADVDDARRVAQQLDIDHVVFNFTDDFDAHVVDPYIEAHTRGSTPNPCIECNRHLKFDRLLDRADRLGFDGIATGHHCAIERDGITTRLRRGADLAKDQSYVVHMLDAEQRDRTYFPVGDMTKADVRAQATRLGLRTAAKPDSQDVCFITDAGRDAFLGARIPLKAGRIVSTNGEVLGSVAAIELVTIGQRRGLDLGGAPGRRYAVDVDVNAGVVTVGNRDDLLVAATPIHALTSTAVAGRSVLVQTSAHARTAPAVATATEIVWEDPHVKVAPGQSVVFYDETDRYVLGGAVAL